MRSAIYFVLLWDWMSVHGEEAELPPLDFDDEITPYTITGTSCKDTAQSNEVWCSLWMLNEDGEVSQYIEDGGVYALVNVEDVTVPDDEVDSASTFTIYASGVPNYQITATQELIDSLNSRPKDSGEFASGSTTLEVGDVIDFGQDIGYLKNGTFYCEHGFWPPGPVCPENVAKSLILPTSGSEPATYEEANQCFHPLGLVAVLLNGVSLFSWADGFSYHNEDVWHNLAAKYEVYDVDICAGHAARSEYHHHSYSPCLEELVGDDGSGHSPIIGMTPDGYFHYGLYQSAGVTAKSCWKARNYSDPNDPLGCGGTGDRTCTLVDNLDPDAGTEPAEKDGPRDDDVYTSLSQNTFISDSGSYYQDWYFDPECYAQGGEYLDEHNGHSHDDYGYHYHTTETFPFQVGPTTFYGQVNVEGWPCEGFAWDEKAASQPGRAAAIAESIDDETVTSPTSTTPNEDDGEEDGESSVASMLVLPCLFLLALLHFIF